MRFSDKRTFLTTRRTRHFATTFLSVCVSNLDNVSTTGRLQGASTSYLLIFAAASASRTLRKFRMQTFRCLIGPFSRTRLSNLLSRVLTGLPHPRPILAIGISNDSVRLHCHSVVSTRRFTRVVGVHAATNGALTVHRDFGTFARPLGGSPHFFIYNHNAVVGVRGTTSFRSTTFYVASNDRICIDRRLLGTTQRTFVRFLLREKHIN